MKTSSTTVARTLTLGALLVCACSAKLYPTKPAATTWYTLSAKERTLDLRWRDTPEEPRAAALGSVRVQLLSGDEVVAYLWPEIDAAAGHASVKVPRDVALASGSEYFIRFVPSTHRSAAAVYTADFTIVNATLPPVAPAALAAARQAFAGPSPENVAASNSSASGTTLTITPTTTWKTPASSAASSTGPSDAVAKLGTAVNAARATRLGWTGGAASFKSKALFVVWPVLIGVALAV